LFQKGFESEEFIEILMVSGINDEIRYLGHYQNYENAYKMNVTHQDLVDNYDSSQLKAYNKLKFKWNITKVE
jgi:hypothetical protein